MADYELLKWQRDQVFDWVVGEGFDPREFEWGESFHEETPSVKFQKLAYRGTDFFFQFEFAQVKKWVAFSPSHEGRFDRENVIGWFGVFPPFERWLHCLQYEIQMPDRWADLEKLRFFDGEKLRDDIPNEPFSSQQVEQITDAIESLKSHIDSQFELTRDALEKIHKRLDYMEEMAKRLGRFDWLNAATGVVSGLVISGLFNPEQAKSMWEFFWNTLKGILQLPQ